MGAKLILYFSIFIVIVITMFVVYVNVAQGKQRRAAKAAEIFKEVTEINYELKTNKLGMNKQLVDYSKILAKKYEELTSNRLDISFIIKEYERKNISNVKPVQIKENILDSKKFKPGHFGLIHNGKCGFYPQSDKRILQQGKCQVDLKYYIDNFDKVIDLDIDGDIEYTALFHNQGFDNYREYTKGATPNAALYVKLSDAPKIVETTYGGFANKFINYNSPQELKLFETLERIAVMQKVKYKGKEYLYYGISPFGMSMKGEGMKVYIVLFPLPYAKELFNWQKEYLNTLQLDMIRKNHSE